MTRGAPGRVLRAAVALGAAVVVLPACATIPLSGPVVPGPDLQRDADGGTVQQLAFPPGGNADPELIVSGFLQAGVDYRRRHEVARSYLTPSWRSRWEPGASVLVTPHDTGLKITRISSTGDVPPPVPSASPSASPSATSSAGSSATSSAGSSVATPSGSSAPSSVRPPDPSAAPAPSGPPSTNPAPRVVLRIDLPVTATVDDQGRYREAPAGEMRTLDYTVERRGGEWRITNLPDGIVLGESNFRATFRSYAVYFPDAAGRHLIPDLRWFPAVGETLRAVPTALVAALLDGPSDWLEPVVVSGAPEGTTLGRPAVIIADGDASVDLSAEARLTSVSQRQRLLGQLRATLHELRTVNEVTVTADGRELDLGGGSGRAQLPLDVDPLPDTSHLVFVSDRHRLMEPGPDKSLPVAGLGLRAEVSGVDGLNRPDVSHPAVDRNATTYSALVAGRTVLLAQPPGAKTAKQLLAVNRPGAHLSPPSFDSDGWIWSTSDQLSPAVTAVTFAGGAAQVAARWLAPYSVLDLRVSRDGARAAIVARRNNQSLVFVAPIRRGPDGRPDELGEPIRIAPRVSGASAVAWADDDEIVLIGAPGPGDGGPAGSPGPAVWLSQIGGMTQGLGHVRGADSITAADSLEQIYVGTDDGHISYHPGQWVTWTDGRWPAMPG